MKTCTWPGCDVRFDNPCGEYDMPFCPDHWRQTGTMVQEHGRAIPGSRLTHTDPFPSEAQSHQDVGLGRFLDHDDA